MRVIVNWAFSLLAAFHLVSTCQAQEPATVADTTSRGETIIASLFSENDLPGLAEHARQLLAAARAKNRIIAEQGRVVATMQEERQEMQLRLHELQVQIAFEESHIADQVAAQKALLEDVRKDLDAERQERERMQSTLTNLGKRGKAHQIQSALAGLTAGAAITQKTGGAALGASIGWFLEWLIQRRQ